MSWLDNDADLAKITYIDPNLISNQIDDRLPQVQDNMKIFYRNFKSAFNL
jgi:hypothetical protein